MTKRREDTVRESSGEKQGAGTTETANETSSRRVGVWKGTAIRVRVQFGKGYKRKIYDNALCVEGGLSPRGVAGDRRGGGGEDGGSRSRRGLGVVPNATPLTFHHPSPVHSPPRRPYLAFLVLDLTVVDQPLAPTVVDTTGPRAWQASRRREFCACHGRHCVRTCVLARPRLIPGFRISPHHGHHGKWQSPLISIAGIWIRQIPPPPAAAPLSQAYTSRRLCNSNNFLRSAQKDERDSLSRVLPEK